jgi:hypothetical protein
MKTIDKPLEKKTEQKCFIWDEPFPEQYWGVQSDRILNRNDFDDFDFSEVNIIYILVELNWNAKKRAEFHGFELARDLRMVKKLLCPIVFCSFMPDFDILKYSEAKILDTPGHYLLQLPSKPLEYSKFKAIDEDMLYDINMHIFDSIGMLHSLMHDLENSCDSFALKITDKDKLNTQIQELTRTKLKDFNNCILDERKSDFTQLIYIILTELKQEIFNNPDLKKGNRIRQIFDTYKSQIYAMLPVALSDKHESDYPIKRWSILFIDDMESTCAKVKDMFLKRGITCETANTAEDAFRILSVDEENKEKIAVIISDFRLYENGIEGKWQTFQGYQILKTVHEQSEIYKSQYAYSILTSKKGTILDRIKQRSSFPVLWFYKADVLSNDTAFNIFYQRICEAGSDAFFRKHNIPDTAVWKRGLPGRIDYGYYYFYKQHIESTDYDAVEQEINRQAIDNINHVKLKNELSATFDYQISLLYKKKKGKTETSDNVFDLMNKFRDNILVVRRIYWGLGVFLSKDKTEIFQLLKKDYSDDDDKQNQESMMKGIINTSLGISFNADPSNKKTPALIKYGLLKEEIEFLEKYAETFKVDVSFIRMMNENIDTLSSFFNPIAGFDEIPEISAISKKLDENKKITFEEFKSCLKKISRKKELDGAFNGKFKRATEQFYIFDFNELSDDLKNMLKALKHW